MGKGGKEIDASAGSDVRGENFFKEKGGGGGEKEEAFQLRCLKGGKDRTPIPRKLVTEWEKVKDP